MTDRVDIQELEAPPAVTAIGGIQSRYLRHPGFMTGLVILVLTSVVAIAAPVIAP